MNDVYIREIDTKDNAVFYGDYYDHVYEQHVEAYGEDGAKNTRDAATRILQESIAQAADPSINNNVLLD